MKRAKEGDNRGTERNRHRWMLKIADSPNPHFWPSLTTLPQVRFELPDFSKQMPPFPFPQKVPGSDDKYKMSLDSGTTYTVTLDDAKVSLVCAHMVTRGPLRIFFQQKETEARPVGFLASFYLALWLTMSRPTFNIYVSPPSCPPPCAL